MKTQVLFICDSSGALAALPGLPPADPLYNVAAPTDADQRLFNAPVFHVSQDSTAIAYLRVFDSRGTELPAPVFAYPGITVASDDVRGVALAGVVRAGTLRLVSGAAPVVAPVVPARSAVLSVAPTVAVNDMVPLARAHPSALCQFAGTVADATILTLSGFDPAHWHFLTLGAATPVTGLAPRQVSGGLANFAPLVDIKTGRALPGCTVNPWSVYAFHGERTAAGTAVAAQYPSVSLRATFAGLYRREGVTGFGV